MIKLMKAGHTAMVKAEGGCVTLVIYWPDGTATGSTWGSMRPTLEAARSASKLVGEGWDIV